MIYQDGQGEWYIIDWKTDRVQSGDYAGYVRQHRQQVVRYRKAVEELIGVRPKAWICFLVPEVRLLSIRGR